jgi:hypothetical protein
MLDKYRQPSFGDSAKDVISISATRPLDTAVIESPRRSEHWVIAWPTGAQTDQAPLRQPRSSPTVGG